MFLTLDPGFEAKVTNVKRSTSRTSWQILPAALLCWMAAGPATVAKTPALQTAIHQAKNRVFPALVHIQPILEVFRAGERGQVAVTGSGVIFSEEGYVLTNNHVVEGAQRLICTLADQQEVRADLIGRDPYTDLAVIKLDLSQVDGGVHHAQLGSSSSLEAGEFVIAMGSPLGLARSISVGVISTVERYFPEARMPGGAITGTFNTWIQTDAAINPGNSGGPLVNLDGEVIGINARAIPIFGENLGFAIPIDLAREVSAELIENGRVQRSWIGVSWQHLEAAPGLVGASRGNGVLVASVVRGSPADELGLEPGDVVLSIAGRELQGKHEEQLPRIRKSIADLPVGSEVEVSYMRRGRNSSGSLVTAELEDLEDRELEIKAWGFTARGISEEIARQLRLDDQSGALVTGVKPNSFAFEAGLRPGELIRRMDGQTVPNLRVFEQRVSRFIEARTGQVLLEVQRGQTTNFRLIEPLYDEAGDSDSGEGR